MSKLHSAKPEIPFWKVTRTSQAEAVKVATSNLFDLGIQKTLSEDEANQIADLYINDISAQELISFSRENHIDQENLNYQPIKNLPQINKEKELLKVLGLQSIDRQYFDGFPLDLTYYLPDDLNNVYFNKTTQKLEITLVNLGNYKVEIEFILSDGVIADSEW